MIKYNIKNNLIMINDNSVPLTKKVRQVYEFDNKLIILQDYKEKNKDNEPNIICYDEYGNLLWEIAQIRDKNNKYIKITEEKDQLILIDEEHFKYVINPKTGEFIKERIMYLKDIDDTSETLLTKTNIIQLFAIIIIILFIISFIKNTIHIDLSNSEQTQETIEDTEYTINDKNNSLTDLKNIIEEELPDNLKNKKNNNSENNSNSQEETKSNTTNTSIENTKEDKYEGFNKFLGIIDEVGNTISTGDKKTINDVNGDLIACTVSTIIDNCRFTAIYNDEEITIRLIGIEKSNIGKEYLEALLPIESNIYLEQDTKKINSLNEYLAYVWVFPTTDDKNNMVNYYLIHNGYANFELQTPNIKYNYYFQK